MEKDIVIAGILDMKELHEKKKIFGWYTDTLTMQIIIFSMHQTQYHRILHDPVANGARDEILGETTVRLCQISSDSLFLSIFYKKGATLYSTRRTKIMEDRSGKQTSAYWQVVIDFLPNRTNHRSSA